MPVTITAAIMIDAKHLQAHRTSAGLLRSGCCRHIGPHKGGLKSTLELTAKAPRQHLGRRLGIAECRRPGRGGFSVSRRSSPLKGIIFFWPPSLAISARRSGVIFSARVFPPRFQAKALPISCRRYIFRPSVLVVLVDDRVSLTARDQPPVHRKGGGTRDQ
jgi:hypothetical protein